MKPSKSMKITLGILAVAFSMAAAIYFIYNKVGVLYLQLSDTHTELLSDLQNSNNDVAWLVKKTGAQDEEIAALKAKIKDLSSSRYKAIQNVAVYDDKNPKNLEDLSKSFFEHSTRPYIIEVPLDETDKMNAICDKESKFAIDALRQLIEFSGRTAAEKILFENGSENSALKNHIYFIGNSYFIYKPLIKPLLDYYSKIKANENWEKKAQEIANTDGQIYGSQLYDKGFPKSENECFTQFPGGNPFDAWLYRFWIMQYKNGTMEQTYSLILSLDKALENSIDNPYHTFIWPSPRITSIEETAKDSPLFNIYKNLLIPRSIESSTVNFYTSKKDKPKYDSLYFFDHTYNNHTIEYVQTTEDTNEGTYKHQYINNNIPAATPFMYTATRHTEPLNIYYPQEPGKDAIDKISRFLQENFGTPGAIDNTFYGENSCSELSVKAFRNSNQTIYAIEKNCSDYGHDGNTGPYVFAVIGQNADDTLSMKNIFMGNIGGITFRGNFVADIDNDGNIELMLNNAEGLSSSDIVVELNGDGWSVLRELEDYYEGDDSVYKELPINDALLYQ